jgi:hypothetical protein
VFTEYSAYFLPNIRHFCRKPNTQNFGQKNRFLLVCILKMWEQTKIKDFWEILGLVSQKTVYKLFTQTDQNLNNFFADYRQVFGCLYRIFGCRIFGRLLFGRIFGRQDCRSFTNNKDIHIHVDSQAALQSLIKSQITSKTVHQTVELLRELAGTHTVTLQWVKAHVGMPGNEMADEAAKAASQI